MITTGLMPTGTGPGQQLSRRRFLIAAASGAGGLVGLATLNSVLGGSLSDTNTGVLGPGMPTALALADIPAEYLPMFQAAGTVEVPWNMLAAVAWKESSWSPDVILGRRNSSAGAGGIMQIMPDTAIGLGISHADRFIPVIAIPAAAGMLNGLKAQFGSDELMLAAYNAGPGNVELYGGIPPFPETQAYVPAVINRAKQYADLGPIRVVAGTWTPPTPLPMGKRRFGMRMHPISGVMKMHTGVDIGGPKNSPLYAIGNGQVIFAQMTSGYGFRVMIDHGQDHGVSTYNHMTDAFVRAGQTVQTGQHIAGMDTKGLSTGVHLHFEIKVNGGYVDPEPFMAARGATLPG